MSRARESYNKKDHEKAKQQKRKEKEQRKEERKANAGKGKSDEEMFAYVDAFGNILSAPPDPQHRPEVKLEDIRISTVKKEDQEAESPYRTGTLTFFDDTKGFGFIMDQESKQKIFVHISGMEGEIKENDTVVFEVENGARGPQAVRVKKVVPPTV